MQERGKFIVYEGAGGSGKDTQLELSAEYLKSRGLKVKITREPGGVTESEVIRELIFKLKVADAANADHLLAFFFAARDFWIKGQVSPNVELGVHVLSGRSYPSTVSYQCYGGSANISYVEKMTKIIMGKYMPDGIILYDISPATSIFRSDKGRDPFDRESEEFLEKVVQGYREMAKTNWSGVPWYVINGEQPIEKVFEKTKEVLDKLIIK